MVGVQFWLLNSVMPPTPTPYEVNYFQLNSTSTCWQITSCMTTVIKVNKNHDIASRYTNFTQLLLLIKAYDFSEQQIFFRDDTYAISYNLCWSFTRV